MKIKFAKGSFDDFDGTQEQLDQLIESIQKMAVDGTLLEQSAPIDLDSLEEENPELYDKVMNFAGQEFDEDIDDDIEYKSKMN